MKDEEHGHYALLFSSLIPFEFAVMPVAGEAMAAKVTP